MSRRYIDVVAPTKDVYTLDRYYRYSKTVSGLKMIVIRAISAHNEYLHPYFCVVYSLSGAKPGEVVEISCAPHGNSKQSRRFSKTYIHTNPSVLAQMDSLLENDTPSNVFHQLLNESGGPIFSNSVSSEPRNMTQVANRKTVKKRKLATTSFASPQSDLERLISAQRDSSSPVRTVAVSGDSYIAFLYTDKQLKDIELFCCDPNDNKSCVLGIDTTFKLCNMWITDTSYRNKQLLSSRTRKNPVHLGPTMMHFTKDEGTCRKICVELISANPQLINLKKVGVDIEDAIFNGFQSVICKLLQLYCARHLKQRDEKAIDSCHQKSSIADNKKASYKKEIIWDIYGKRTSDILEKGNADTTDPNDFHLKPLTLCNQVGRNFVLGLIISF